MLKKHYFDNLITVRNPSAYKYASNIFIFSDQLTMFEVLEHTSSQLGLIYTFFIKKKTNRKKKHKTQVNDVVTRASETVAMATS